MAQSKEGRDILGFFAAAFSGPIVLGAILAVTRGFTSETLMLTLGSLFFSTGPGVLLGMPLYYAVRKERIPGRWLTVAFGLAASTIPVTTLVALGVGVPPDAPDIMRLLVLLVIALGSAFCGSLGGFMFWTLVFKPAVAVKNS